jgi:Enoyl-CoA hydratase/carnithine racemase
MTDVLEGPVLVFRQGALGRIKLNRPKALNSLNTEMAGIISRALDRFEAEGGVVAVLLDGAGDRGLCAGGDIREMYEAVRAGTDGAARFLRAEYELNARIARFAKPFIAIMDGIVMGGGIGLSVHGRHRIVTERSRLAMPEVSIGFVPDVGATWYLAKAPGELGTYLALTGESFAAGDAIQLGFADMMIPTGRLDELVETLVKVSSADEIETILEDFEEPAQGIVLPAYRDEIDAAFLHDDAESIVAALDRSVTAFAQETRETILAKCPMSVKLALRLVRLARNASTVEECLLNEYRAGVHAIQRPDFLEGVRAAIVDKDRKPRWEPAELSAISDDEVARCFEPLAEEPQFRR